jgi:hypothetical protein
LIREAEEAKLKTAEYNSWEFENMTKFSADIILNFSQLFVFFAFSVTFCAVRNPSDFGAALSFANVMIHIAFVYAMYA